MNPLVVVLPVSRPDYHLAVKWLKWAIARYKADCEAVLGGRCAAYYVK